MQSWPIIGKMTENSFFDRLAVSYDCAVGFVKAQEDCLSLLESMYRGEGEEERPNLEVIEQEINENIISGQTFMRNLRNTYPEIYRAIATRQAIRSVLNYELHTVERLKGKGRLNNSEVGRITSDIEARMKKLMEKPPSIQLPETKELVRSIHWLEDFSKEGVKLFSELCQTRIYANGQRIVKNMNASHGLYIIARGNVNIKDGKRTIEVLSKGDGIGEILYLTQGQSQFQVIAETPVTVLWLSTSNLERMISTFPEFKKVMWQHALGRMAVRALAGNDQYKHMDKRQMKSMGEQGKLIELSEGTIYASPADKTTIMVSGSAVSTQNEKLVVGDAKVVMFKEMKAVSRSWVLEVSAP
jgi:CRP-like cAMP-binding protein